VGIDTPLGEIFDPVANSWSPLEKPAAFDFIQGDAPSCILADGRVLLGGPNFVPSPADAAIWDPAATTNAWSLAGTRFGTTADTMDGQCGECTWALLPDGSVMEAEIIPVANGPNSAQRYLPATDEWVPAGTTPNPLIAGNAEIGPALMLPNGQLFQVGASGLTALYDPATDAWSNGPAFPLGPPYNTEYAGYPNLTACDAPAVLQPNGKVICAAGAYVPDTGFSQPTTFLEFDPATYNPAVGAILPKLAMQPPAGSASGPTYNAIFLPLPSGDILFSSGQAGLWLYTPDPADPPNPAWKPVITDAPASVKPGGSYVLEGQQFNGLSQAASFGDDAQMATNYPIIRIQNVWTGNLFYCRTHDHSTMGVATGTAIVSTHFDVPATMDPGAAQLYVVANGIASDPVSLEVEEGIHWKFRKEVKGLDKPGEKVPILDVKPIEGSHGGEPGSLGGTEGVHRFLADIDKAAEGGPPDDESVLRRGFIREEERPEVGEPGTPPSGEES
jgi:hypothetical protein